MSVCVQVNSDVEAMVEVVDGWLARLYPNTPTWREVADLVEQIGHHQLSHSIKQVYLTGGGGGDVINNINTSVLTNLMVLCVELALLTCNQVHIRYQKSGEE